MKPALTLFTTEHLQVPLRLTMPFIPFDAPVVSKKIAQKNQDIDSMEINRLKSQLTAANEQATLVHEREDEINRLKLQLTAANEQATLVHEREDEISRLKSQLTAANELVLGREDEIANLQATLVREHEDEINKLKLQLTTTEHKAHQLREREEELKGKLADIFPAFTRYKQEARDLRPKLENVNRKLEEARDIFDQDIQCGICLDVMWHPMSLTECRHSFCDNCLFKHIKAGNYKCALCDAVTGLPREDKQLRSLIEKVACFLDESNSPNTVFDETRFRDLFPPDVIYV